MKTLLASAIGICVLASCISSGDSPPAAEPRTSKVYVALEEGKGIAVLDPVDLSVVTRIDLGDAMVHNVQVSPCGCHVWATAPAMPMEGMAMEDEVVVVNPHEDAITSRIRVGGGVHPAHVVLGPDSKIAYVTGTTKNEVIRIDASTRQLIDRRPLGHGAGAHGERMSPDGTTLWVAEVEGECVAKVPTAGGTIEHVMLEGQAVQTAVTDDGKWVFASIYTTKRVARIDAKTSAVDYATLPPEAQGPVQLYPTPDGKTMLVADQGVLDNRPPSNKLYFVDVETLAVTGSVVVGSGAHGVVTHGDRAYVTAIADGTVTAIDLATRTVVATAHLGADSKPNGITVWTDSR